MPKVLLMEKIILLQCLSRAFIANPLYKIPKKKKNNSKSYYKGQIGKKQKNVTKRSKRQKAGKVNSTVRGKQWHRRKFRNLRKFAG